MDVLRGDKEWRDKGSDREVTKGVIKQGWDFFYYLRIENAEGYGLITVYLFIYLFVCVLLA